MGKLDALREEILKRAQVICDTMGLELVDLLVHSYNETLHVQLLADRLTGGIEIDECTKLNHQLDAVLFEELKLGNNYTLEVSSPGLDRPLKSFKDFRRVMGRDVYIFLRERMNGKIELEGLIKGVRDEDIILETKKGEIVIPIALIDKGKQIII
ncbi:MAG: ribosome maturation factor RimP [Candidatus Omnitrophica bacterium]|nr:ribosome maturation factor RimP [Candidatus Omnitrophota bacterium]